MRKISMKWRKNLAFLLALVLVAGLMSGYHTEGCANYEGDPDNPEDNFQYEWDLYIQDIDDGVENVLVSWDTIFVKSESPVTLEITAIINTGSNPTDGIAVDVNGTIYTFESSNSISISFPYTPGSSVPLAITLKATGSSDTVMGDYTIVTTTQDLTCSNCGGKVTNDPVHPYSHNSCSLCNAVCDGTSDYHMTCSNADCAAVCDGSVYSHIVCPICGETCNGTEIVHGNCMVCGVACQDDMIHNGCPSCGAVCNGLATEHGVCAACGGVCDGTGYQHNNCALCGVACGETHKTCYVCGGACDGNSYHRICMICSTVCDGESITHGNCAVCGGACNGTDYAHGACSVCGGVCNGLDYQHKECHICHGVCDGTEDYHNTCGICGGVCDGTDDYHKTCPGCGGLCDFSGGAFIHMNCLTCGGTCDGTGIQHAKCDKCNGGCNGEEFIHDADCEYLNGGQSDSEEEPEASDPTDPADEPDETEPAEKPDETEPAEKPDGVPNTGDNANVMLWLSLMMAAMMSVLVLTHKMKRAK